MLKKLLTSSEKMPYLPYMKYYTLENKPKFKQNDIVKVDFSCLGSDNYGIKSGLIVGKGIEHILDFWLIDFGSKISKVYPYSVASIQHTFIIDESKNS